MKTCCCCEPFVQCTRCGGEIVAVPRRDDRFVCHCPPPDPPAGRPVASEEEEPES